MLAYDVPVMNKKIILSILAVIIVLSASVAGIFLAINYFRPQTVNDSSKGSPQTSTEITASNRFGTVNGIQLFAEEEKQAGVGIDREWINWGEIEPTKDNYSWTKMDQMVKTANDTGIEILGYFVYTPDWAKTNPGCTSDICAINDMGEFKEFARDVAQRYDGRHGHGDMKYIEILNEVTLPQFFDLKNTDYTDWLIAGYDGVKAGNPNAQVLIGGFVNPLDVKSFVEDMLQNYDRYYDIVNFHVYASDPTVNDAAVYMKEKMSRFNVNKPMWITETATIPVPDVPDPHTLIARGVIKRYASAFGNGVERVFWWPFMGTPAPDESPQGGSKGTDKSATKDPSRTKGKVKLLGLGWVNAKGSGLPTDEFHPRQAYETYKLMTSKLSGFSDVQKITDTQYKFTVDGKDIYVLWGNEQDPIPGEISGKVIVTDIYAEAREIDTGDMVLSDSPIFVEKP